jgi:hypothetical protein
MANRHFFDVAGTGTQKCGTVARRHDGVSLIKSYGAVTELLGPWTRPKTNQEVNKTMKNRCIILTAILSLLGCGGLSCIAQAADSTPVRVVNTPKVNVANTTTNPVPVQDAENPARNAVESSVALPITSSPQTQASITIPADKIFVLEFVSFNGFELAPNVTVERLAITVTGNLVQGGQGSATYELAIPSPSRYGSQVMRLYAQPGTVLEITSVVSSTSSGAQPSSLTVSLSGYFVDAQ